MTFMDGFLFWLGAKFAEVVFILTVLAVIALMFFAVLLVIVVIEWVRERWMI